MDYIIRKPTSSDAEKMLEYLKIIGGETDNLTFGAEGFPISLENEKRYLDNLLESKTSAIFVAMNGDTIIGDISFDGSSRERLKHRGSIGLSVRRDYWHMGVGSALMEKALDFAKNVAGAEVVVLEVRCENERAISLYEKYDFEITGRIPAMMKINGRFIDCYTMTRFL